MKNRGGKRLAHRDTDRRRENLPEAVEKPAETEEGGAGSEMSRGRRLWHDYGYLVVTLAVVFVLFRVLLQLAEMLDENSFRRAGVLNTLAQGAPDAVPLPTGRGP